MCITDVELYENTACVPIKTPGTSPVMGITSGKSDLKLEQFFESAKNTTSLITSRAGVQMTRKYPELSNILNNKSVDQLENLLIELLAASSVRKEMCLPILLLMEQSSVRISKLIMYIAENRPTEHLIIQRALQLDGENHRP